MSVKTHPKLCQFFQYFGDMIGESGGCVHATSARTTVAWKGFRQHLNRGNIFSPCIRKSFVYGCEIWPASSETIRRLTSSDNGMVCWICGVRLEQRIRENTTRSSV